MLQPTYLLSKLVSFRIWESQWVLFLLVTETLEKWMRAEVRALGQRDTWGWRRGCAPTSTWCSTWPGRPSTPVSLHRCQPGTCQRHFELLILFIRSCWKNFDTHPPHCESLESSWTSSVSFLKKDLEYNPLLVSLAEFKTPADSLLVFPVPDVDQPEVRKLTIIQMMMTMMMTIIQMMMIYILWWSVCLFVCNEKWALPPGSLL